MQTVHKQNITYRWEMVQKCHQMVTKTNQKMIKPPKKKIDLSI